MAGEYNIEANGLKRGTKNSLKDLASVNAL